jgi:hypothetical protein
MSVKAVATYLCLDDRVEERGHIREGVLLDACVFLGVDGFDLTG